MAPFGDGGGGGGGGDGAEALRGWDPLRSGSAPPTMEGAAAAAVAAERVFGGGGASFFSGIDGLGFGARMDEVSRHRGAAGAQVRGVAALDFIDGFGFFGGCRLDRLGWGLPLPLFRRWASED